MKMQFFTEDYLEHHGILGQKWGVRRYQNKDGSLTTAGKKRRKQSNPIDDFYAKQRLKYPTLKKYVIEHQQEIAKQTGTMMANDIFRWREECKKSDDPEEKDLADYYDKLIKGRSKSQVGSDISRAVNRKITNSLKETWGHQQVLDMVGIYEIEIDGIHEYGDSQPVSIVVDPKTNKVKTLWWI